VLLDFVSIALWMVLVSVAFNDSNSQEHMKKVADEYDLFLAEDYHKKLVEYDKQQDEEIKKLEAEIRELKAKLAEGSSRAVWERWMK
jgi:uncharacterized protein YlxW (UPF0749 family)